MTIIHIYAPTEEADEHEKNEFYSSVVDNKNQKNMFIITGDMNAKVGDRNWNFERVMGKHGMGERNDNGERLCEVCDLNELAITETLLPPKTIHKATWISRDGRTRSQIDHIFVNKRFRNSVDDTRVYRSADIGRDHYLVCTTTKLRLKKALARRSNNRVKYETSKLKDKNARGEFKITPRDRYEVLEEEEKFANEENEVERDFHVMKKAYIEVA